MHSSNVKLTFTKMHGLGNDFMVVDATRTPFSLTSDQIRQLSDRHFGVGFDQLLVVEPPQGAEALFRYRIFNADGTEVEQCGNGARCFARFVRDKGLTNANVIPVETLGGLITLTVEPDGQITVNMGQPVFDPERIPFVADRQADDYALTIDTMGSPTTVSIGVVSMGNPHAVLCVDNVDTAPVAEWGPLLERHPRFPHRVNVGFMQLLSRNHIRLRVFERGAGETLACGTGACAAVVSGIRRGWLESRCRVSLAGGDLIISWGGMDEPVMMTGPAITVFEGHILLPEK